MRRKGAERSGCGKICHDRFGNRGKTPGRHGPDADHSRLERRKMAEFCGRRCATVVMLHLRARGFAPITRFVYSPLLTHTFIGFGGSSTNKMG